MEGFSRSLLKTGGGLITVGAVEKNCFARTYEVKPLGSRFAQAPLRFNTAHPDQFFSRFLLSSFLKSIYKPVFFKIAHFLCFFSLSLAVFFFLLFFFLKPFLFGVRYSVARLRLAHSVARDHTPPPPPTTLSKVYIFETIICSRW